MSSHGRPTTTGLDAAGMEVAIVASRWHPDQTDRLVERATAAALSCGATPTVLRVAGAWELPLIAAAAADHADALVVLGCIVRGGTPHFDHLCRTVYDGLLRVALDSRTPVGNGVLTCDTAEQASARAGGPDATEDKGWDAAVAAIGSALTLRQAAHSAVRLAG